MFWNKEQTKEEQQIEVVAELKDNNLLNECLEHFILSKKFNLIQRETKNRDILLQEVDVFLSQYKISDEQKERVKENFRRYIFGYYFLDDLIADPDISDIKIISKSIVRIKKLGKRSVVKDLKFDTNEELQRFIKIVAIRNEINLSDINAVQTFTDKFTSKDFILRITVSTEYVSSVEHGYLAIRKIPRDKLTLEQLEKLGFGTHEQLEYLKKRVQEGKSIIFVGAGGSGKTTLINALLDQGIPFSKDGLVIQENEELFSKVHPGLMFQRQRVARGESKVSWTLEDLTKEGLLLDIDYFIIGEIKGREAKYFFNAAYTGHGALTSLHGESPEGGIDKLIDYIKLATDYSREDLLRMLQCVKNSVYIKDFKIVDIAEITGFDEVKKNMTYKKVLA